MLGIEKVLLAETTGMLIGVLIVALYSWRRTSKETGGIEEGTALIVEYMRRNHERKIKMMRFMNDIHKPDDQESTLPGL